MFRIVFWDVLPYKIIVNSYFTRQYIPEDSSEHHSFNCFDSLIHLFSQFPSIVNCYIMYRVLLRYATYFNGIIFLKCMYFFQIFKQNIQPIYFAKIANLIPLPSERDLLRNHVLEDEKETKHFSQYKKGINRVVTISKRPIHHKIQNTKRRY
jgi:hypothetical protein